MATLESISDQLVLIHKTCDATDAKMDKMDERGTRVCIKNSERIRTMWWSIGLLAGGGTGAAGVAALLGKATAVTTGAGQ